MFNKKIFLLLPFMLSSCISVKLVEKPDVSKTKIINSDFDKVWEKITSYLSETNVPIKNMEKVSGFISTENIKFKSISDKNVVICDRILINKTTEVEDIGTVNYNILVKKINDTKTEVKINVFPRLVHQKRNENDLINDVNCYSTGYIENKFFTFLD